MDIRVFKNTRISRIYDYLKLAKYQYQPPINEGYIILEKYYHVFSTKTSLLKSSHEDTANSIHFQLTPKIVVVLNMKILLTFL